MGKRESKDETTATRYNPIQGAKVIQVLVVSATIGKGTPEDPATFGQALYTLDGKHIVTLDSRVTGDTLKP